MHEVSRTLDDPAAGGGAGDHLVPASRLGPDKAKVTLSYDWPAVGQFPRQHIQFPPFTSGHLDNSPGHWPQSLCGTQLPQVLPDRGIGKKTA